MLHAYSAGPLSRPVYFERHHIALPCVLRGLCNSALFDWLLPVNERADSNVQQSADQRREEGEANRFGQLAAAHSCVPEDEELVDLQQV